ncbi:UDP-glucose 4-epimerase [Deinococcus seoulensis]|uniref:UDP-glucose 4-epimerase n=2 Tax=Deinococcus seoulensis TaxID=1837379 RepID=A0ABQ2RSN4_9DEIO|nr:UDP-glucose 4-epimerase [Deinococcus seoulensis]
MVTGGAGFIGSHVVETALQAGWDVAVLDDLSSGSESNVPPAARLYKVDVRDAAGVLKAMTEFRPTVISHQAAQASVSVSVRDPMLDASVNIIGGLNVLNAARDCGVERVVFASTGGAIYGEVPDGEQATETSVPRPYSPYATSKLAFETYLQTYQQQYGLAYSILRYANVYGPRQNPHGEAGVVAIFATRLVQGQEITINARQETGDDGCIRDYVFVTDVARANLMAAQGKTPAVLNIGTGVPVTTRVLAEQLAEALRVTPQLRFAPPRAGDLERSVIDPTSYEAAIGRLTTLESGLAQTAEWATTAGS